MPIPQIHAYCSRRAERDNTRYERSQLEIELTEMRFVCGFSLPNLNIRVEKAIQPKLAWLQKRYGWRGWKNEKTLNWKHWKNWHFEVK